MLVSYIRVSSDGDRQTTALQRDAFSWRGLFGALLRPSVRPHESTSVRFATFMDQVERETLLRFEFADWHCIRHRAGRVQGAGHQNVPSQANEFVQFVMDRVVGIRDD